MADTRERDGDAGTGASIDARIDEESRRGLTGTARSDIYELAPDPDDVTHAPDAAADADPPQWRADFPIDWPKDEFVARRAFARFMVLTSGAFVAGQGWIAAQHLLRQNRQAGGRMKIASKKELPAGGAKTFSYPSEHDRCILLHLGDGELVAFNQGCTHLSCAVVPRMEEGILHCPCHEGRFDLRTGRNIAGPPPRPLPRIVLSVEGDDVFAVGVEERSV